MQYAICMSFGISSEMPFSLINIECLYLIKSSTLGVLWMICMIILDNTVLLGLPAISHHSMIMYCHCTAALIQVDLL